ncbi:hypothetical protein [Nesterenkonia sp. CF4.4]|uniref:hypothetical protein n=1 Tax=Nesterenkonia sp. CF4.4 TaxID=3373079 RepID=UPI003EE6EB30
MERNTLADIAMNRLKVNLVRAEDHAGAHDFYVEDRGPDWECDSGSCSHRDCLTERDVDIAAMDEYGCHVDPARGYRSNA